MTKPSVTELLDLLAKPALIAWANKQGLAGIDIAALRRQAKRDGTSLHEQIESGEFVDPQHAKAFAHFMRDKELIDQETKVETEWFVGRYDARLKWRGETWLIDYKKSDRPVVYFEHRLQLAAYALGTKADRFAIVAAPGFDMAEAVMRGGLQKYQDIVIALSKIWTIQQEVES